MTVVVATASPSQRCVTSCRTVPCPSSSSRPMAETSPAPTATASCSTPVSSHPCSRTCSASWVRCLSHVFLFCFCFCFSCCPRFGWRMWGVWSLTACGTCSSVIVGDGGLPNAEAVGWVPEPQRMHYKRFIHFHDFLHILLMNWSFYAVRVPFGILGRTQWTLFSHLSMLDFRHPDGHSHTQWQSPQLEHRWTRLEAAGRHAPLHIRSHRNGQGLRSRSAFVFFLEAFWCGPFRSVKTS